MEAFQPHDNQNAADTLWNNYRINVAVHFATSVAQQASPYFDYILGTTEKETGESSYRSGIEDHHDNVAILHEISLSDILKSPSLLEHYNCTHVLVTVPGTAQYLRACSNSAAPSVIHDGDELPNSLRCTLNDSKPLSTVLADEFYNDLVQKYLPKTSNCWFGILSTTAVYGNHEGRWVDEQSPCLIDATSSDSKDRDWINFENRWMQRISKANDQQKSFHSPHCDHGATLSTNHRFRLCIFRCAGIYGATRSALHTLYQRQRSSKLPGIDSAESTSSTQSGSPIVDDGTKSSPSKTVRKSITNRIHEVDLSRAIVASMLQWKSSPSRVVSSSCNNNENAENNIEIYNLADDLPESRDVVMEHAANLLRDHTLSSSDGDESLQLSAQSTAAEVGLNTRARRRIRDQKRVNNSKMKKYLLGGGPLLFPTYREGLHSILSCPETPWMVDKSHQ